MIDASIIADKFKIDPLKVLNADVGDWAIRTACYNAIAELERKREEKNKAKMK